MDIMALQKRLDKKDEELTKKREQLKKLRIDMRKLEMKCLENGWDQDDKRSEACKANNYEGYYTICKIEKMREAITKKSDEVEKIQGQIIKGMDAVAEEIEKANKLATIPQVLVDMINELVDAWTAQDMKTKAFIDSITKEEAKENGFSLNDYYHYKKGNIDCFKRANMTDAKVYVLDLQRRVEEVVGEITSYDNLTRMGVALNGYVEGTKGKAKVETVEAGGWNIQRYHLRTLVKAL